MEAPLSYISSSHLEGAVGGHVFADHSVSPRLTVCLFLSFQTQFPSSVVLTQVSEPGPLYTMVAQFDEPHWPRYQNITNDKLSPH